MIEIVFDKRWVRFILKRPLYLRMRTALIELSTSCFNFMAAGINKSGKPSLFISATVIFAKFTDPELFHCSVSGSSICVMTASSNTRPCNGGAFCWISFEICLNAFTSAFGPIRVYLNSARFARGFFSRRL